VAGRPERWVRGGRALGPNARTALPWSRSRRSARERTASPNASCWPSAPIWPMRRLQRGQHGRRPAHAGHPIARAHRRRGVGRWSPHRPTLAGLGGLRQWSWLVDEW